jgi:hypothetical protein
MKFKIRKLTPNELREIRTIVEVSIMTIVVLSATVAMMVFLGFSAYVTFVGF